MNDAIKFLLEGQSVTLKQLSCIYIANLPRWVFLIPSDKLHDIISSYCVNKAKKHLKRYNEVISGKL